MEGRGLWLDLARPKAALVVLSMFLPSKAHNCQDDSLIE